ncbi:ATP-binding cassette sub-family G member 1 [Condylostylus longicornis]|uniref:ATP-binding cassette sub-family G member 1 n=1 Tax=Condylostylus longicornis TaxID=2530218 RepID=UPI00244DCFCD|nr:ATP-binding cassette sub-family G member 1 [Condylostylus longicornis]
MIEMEMNSNNDSAIEIENIFNSQQDINSNVSTLRFSNIKFNVKEIGCKPKTILKDISGEFKSGRLSLMLGPSGAGKTSLLNVLSGFKQNFSGKIYYNDKECKLHMYRKIVSYITQDFGMFENLNTKETINFAANMKLTGKFMKDKVNVINVIIKLLNLDKCSNCLVSKLSGGEQKRLSIAVELITNPPVMFFDEPTSGLDIVASTQILAYLRKLALGGRIIVCVVHQPSSHLMKLFNDTLVIADGHKLYNGSVSGMVDYFKKWCLVCPEFYNPADFVLEIASGQYGQNKVSDIIDEGLKNTNFVSCKEEIADYNNSCENTPMLSNSTYQNSNHHLICFNVISENTNHKKFSKNFFQQVNYLVRRSLRSQTRDFMCVQLRILCHIFVGILIGVVFYDIGSEASKVLSNASCLFFFVMFLFFSNTMPGILSCPLETSAFLREHLNGWYSKESYFISKLISDIPLQLICPTAFISFAYYLTGQPMESERFAQSWLISFLTVMLGQSIGLVAGSSFCLKLAVFIVPATCIPMLIFSGFFIRSHELSVYLQPLTHISYFRYSFEGFNQAIYGNNRTDLNCSIPFCYFRTAKKFLEEMDMDEDVYLNDIIALISFILFFHFLLYISLVVKVKRAQA